MEQEDRHDNTDVKWESNRPESGAMQFGQDWSGLFLRGDCSMYYAMAIRLALDFLEKANANRLMIVMPLQSLLDELQGTNAQMIDSGKNPCQMLKSWKECLPEVKG